MPVFTVNRVRNKIASLFMFVVVIRLQARSLSAVPPTPLKEGYGSNNSFIRLTRVWFLQIASPQQGDLRLSDPLSGLGAGGGARTRDRRIPTDHRADSLATGPSTPRLTKDHYLSRGPGMVVYVYSQSTTR
ncbi:hypothetical protein PoB_003366900 [Plakobranchus ocellatus]|uniref:Secreted protein n=1 Tax=Plakobranchus ocellatus TaxID=259542 RepID=A0AAV4ALE6_9GAST|nr:hypothetical protein PoB_003366900 [Plakobranchus ocellatus]